MKKILLVTDNRYWREAIGSQKRITALCRHLEAHHALHVLFLGRLSAEDAARLQDQPRPHALEADPGLQTATPVSPAAPAAGPQNPGARAWARQVLHSMRRGLRGERTGGRRFRLQLHEPKLADYRRPAWAERFRNACARINPDIVLVEYARLAWLLESCADALPRGCRTLVDTHDVQHARQILFHAENRIHDIDITATEEARVLAHADAVIAIQPEDARTLGALLPGKPVLLAPHPQALEPQGEPAPGSPPRVGFFGSAMAPNVDAAHRLIERIWPAVVAQSPRAELHLFGSVCEALAHTPLPASVRCRGFVPDLTDAYAQLHVVLNPVGYGGGLKIKSVEALCHARPLVSSAVGAQGLESGAGSAYLLCEEDAGFIAAILALIDDETARARLAQAALAYAAAHFSPEHAFDEIDQFIATSGS
ncbi:glycosyltransferase [Niveibacterium sp. SC-1]|uniref:glycosyltransferase n=1 Tax=Niveibacterium sp. SC-1 TaxID=3135646 RepID=UPI00311F9218